MKYFISILVIFSLLYSCRKETAPISQLELVAEYDIDVSEPSGLAINSAGNILYTVSDNTNKVYKLSTEGVVLQSYAYEGDDLEGVSIFTNDKLLLADERVKNIVELDIKTGSVKTYHMSYDNDQDNAGIEGVTYNPNNKSIYFLNEKNPDKLFQLNNNFQLINEYDLSFANDYSGICYDNEADLLWIISDESQSINKCDLKGKLITSYTVNINKPEGIAITNDKIYIVSDSSEKLYVYKKPE